jgi:hypothetical protein
MVVFNFTTPLLCVNAHAFASELSAQTKNIYALQREIAALRADSLRSLAESFLALAFPPFKPPSLPSATAAGFFFWFDFLRERLGMSHDCCFFKSWKEFSTDGFQCITKSSALKSQLVCPRLQKSPWFLRKTLVTTRRKLVEWWSGVSV